MSLAPLVLLEDEPIADKAHDGLNLAQYADVVAGAAKGTAGPFTIGVYGGWGSGKTSLLKLVRQMLAEDEEARTRIVTVHFNAWQYEHEEHPLVPLVASIVTEVAAEGAPGRRRRPAQPRGRRPGQGQTRVASRCLRLQRQDQGRRAGYR